MKRVIDAIILEIQDNVSTSQLASVFVKFAVDVADGTELADDAVIGAGLTIGEVRKVGAIWRHPHLWETITADVGTKFIYLRFGELIMLASSDAEELLRVIGVIKNVVQAAASEAATFLDGLRPDLEYDEATAERLTATSDANIEQMVEHAKQVVDFLNSGAKEEPRTAQVFQFPTPTTVQ